MSTLDYVDLEQLADLIAARVGATTPRLVEADEAGRILGVPSSWVLHEARASRIPHVRLGRYVRFDPQEITAWWRDQHRRGPRLAHDDDRSPS